VDGLLGICDGAAPWDAARGGAPPAAVAAAGPLREAPPRQPTSLHLPMRIRPM